MKKLLSLAALTLGVLAANAQSTTFKPFRVGFDFGYAKPAGSGSSGGILLAIEPKYALNDKIALGLRIESAAMAKVSVDEDGMATSADLKASGSYLATVDYYFNTNSFRPFVGLGAGIHSLASFSVDDESMLSSDTDLASLEAGNKFGVTPRIGFDYRHFRMALDYNLVGKTGEVKNNYLGIKVGFFLGGGRN